MAAEPPRKCFSEPLQDCLFCPSTHACRRLPPTARHVPLVLTFLVVMAMSPTTENAASAGDSCLHSLSGGHMSYTWIGRTAERSSHVTRYLGPQRLTVHGACGKCKLIPLGRVPIGSFLHPAIRSFPGAIQIQFASHNALDMSRAKGNVPGREHNSMWRGWHRDLWVEGHRKATSSTGVSHLFSRQGKWLMRSAFGA